jgi:hypothetical protein
LRNRVAQVLLRQSSPDGSQRFQIDFRGGSQSEAAATLDLDGASLYVRDHRGLTKFTGW